MKVGYAVLYEDGELVISKNHTLLQKKIIKDYGEFEDTNVPWKNELKIIKKINILNQIESNCIKEWFKGCINLTTLINFKNLDVSDCSNFSRMFAYCKSLQNLNGLQNWNVSSGTNFSRMFKSCISLQNLNELQVWNVSNGTDFSYMFAYCTLLKEIYLTNTLDILKKEMFNKCNKTLKIHWKKHIYTYTDLLEYQTIY